MIPYFPNYMTYLLAMASTAWPEALTVLLNEAMKIERQPTSERPACTSASTSAADYANGYKPKTVRHAWAR